jgi:hypothetical protein
VALQQPEHLIDPLTGIVSLFLVPFHLSRLHGPFQAPDEDLIHLPAGMPFPLLPGGEPVEIQLVGGMTPDEIGPSCGFEPNSSLGQESWWRWAAYAYTPCGWYSWPTPFFRSGKLNSLNLGLDGQDADRSYEVIREFLLRELGEEGCESGLRSRGWGPFRAPREAVRRYSKWIFPWGSVSVGYEPRDWGAQMGVAWGR